MSDAGVRPLIEVRIERKTYATGLGGTADVAVRDLRLVVYPAEVLCLVGPSGCGKTTTLRILLGLDRSFEGHVVPDPKTLAIRIMFQEPRLLAWRTVEQNVRLVLPAARRTLNLDALFGDLGLDDWRGRYPGELSLGLARRVALARALADPPRLLVLDEPFVSLDERAASALRAAVLARAERDGMAIVLVTHNIREALATADRIVVLSQRPANVLGEVELGQGRDDRPPDWIEQQRLALSQRFATLEA